MSHVIKIKLNNGAQFSVPADMDEKMQKAHAVMQSQGYACNAAWGGFQAFVDGKHLRDNPYSIITNIIENRRWAHGFGTARNVNRLRVQIRGGKGNWFVRVKETGEILASEIKKEAEAFSICTKNGWYTCN